MNHRLAQLQCTESDFGPIKDKRVYFLGKHVAMPGAEIKVSLHYNADVYAIITLDTLLTSLNTKQRDQVLVTRNCISIFCGCHKELCSVYFIWVECEF